MQERIGHYEREQEKGQEHTELDDLSGKCYP